MLTFEEFLELKGYAYKGCYSLKYFTKDAVDSILLEFEIFRLKQLLSSKWIRRRGFVPGLGPGVKKFDGFY
ncbi:hypothetical protein Phi39:1_gp45 [Cellulophaga phage phi39:1]|uniref:hypothetical protein n=1 Tax=Cellulophaga phage phi39:1 TaxID=1327993 RepID=UPI000351739A|nr:hypothetical protein Phi39:1_gp45 [Cellulophaga phage phi39:1]AGO49160.1 hypothetical protein Phi39:1_gp45 [Cellulophaga phage phi39:1]